MGRCGWGWGEGRGGRDRSGNGGCRKDSGGLPLPSYHSLVRAGCGCRAGKAPSGCWEEARGTAGCIPQCHRPECPNNCSSCLPSRACEWFSSSSSPPRAGAGPVGSRGHSPPGTMGPGSPCKEGDRAVTGLPSLPRHLQHSGLLERELPGDTAPRGGSQEAAAELVSP